MLPKELDDSLAFNIYRTSLLFRRELIRALAEYDLTPEQWQVLVTLWSKKHPINQQELVRLSLKDKPTISRMIKRMQQNGWVQLTPGSRDKRVVLVTPADKALSMKQEIFGRLRSHFKDLLKEFSQEEKQVTITHLKTLRNLLGDDSN